MPSQQLKPISGLQNQPGWTQTGDGKEGSGRGLAMTAETKRAVKKEASFMLEQVITIQYLSGLGLLDAYGVQRRDSGCLMDYLVWGGKQLEGPGSILILDLLHS